MDKIMRENQQAAYILVKASSQAVGIIVLKIIRVFKYGLQLNLQPFFLRIVFKSAAVAKIASVSRLFLLRNPQYY